MSRICPGGLLSSSPYIITKNLFPPRWNKCFLLPLITACSLYLTEEKIMQNGQGNENALYFVNNFFPPVACQSTAGQAIIFPPKINACVLCVPVLCKTRVIFPRINGPNVDAKSVSRCKVKDKTCPTCRG